MNRLGRQFGTRVQLESDQSLSLRWGLIRVNRPLPLMSDEISGNVFLHN